MAEGLEGELRAQRLVRPAAGQRRRHLGVVRGLDHDLIRVRVRVRVRVRGRLDHDLSAMVKAGDIGHFGGGSLEHPRQWLGAQCAGLFLGVLRCPEPPGAP